MSTSPGASGPPSPKPVFCQQMMSGRFADGLVVDAHALGHAEAVVDQ
jgi:hypothetical protein